MMRDGAEEIQTRAKEFLERQAAEQEDGPPQGSWASRTLFWKLRCNPAHGSEVRRMRTRCSRSTIWPA